MVNFVPPPKPQIAPTHVTTADDRARRREEWGERRPRKLLALLDAEPPLAAPFLRYGSAVLDRVDARAIELVALRVSAVRGNRYEWAGHCEIALRRGALSHDDIVRLTAGPTVFRGRDAAVLWAVDHVLANRDIDPATRDELAGDVLSLTHAVKFYDAVAYHTRALDPEPDVAPVRGIETPVKARATYEEQSS